MIMTIIVASNLHAFCLLWNVNAGHTRKNYRSRNVGFPVRYCFVVHGRNFVVR